MREKYVNDLGEKTMRILFLSAANSIHTVRWVNALAKLGHDVFLVYNADHEPKNDVIDLKVQKYCLKFSGSKAYYLNAPQLRRFAKKLNPDVINVHYASGYGTLARWADLPKYILSIWGSDVYDFPYESKIKNIILKKNIRKASFLASTSYCMAEQLRRVMGNSKLEISITPFGVDLGLFEPLKFEVRKSDDVFIFGNIKAIEEKYGIRELIEAFDILRKRLENMKIKREIYLYIYGDGKQKNEIMDLIKNKKLENKVKLKGKIPNSEVPKALSQIDVFCAISQLDSESFGVAVVEAMAMKKPVIVSDVDGYKEVAVDEETGWIVSRQTIDKMAEKMMNLMLNERLLVKMGEAGRKRVEDFYDWNKNVDDMVKLYERSIVKTQNF